MLIGANCLNLLINDFFKVRSDWWYVFLSDVMSPITSDLRFPLYLMVIYAFFPTGKGHCFPSLTLSYRPVLPLSLKNSGSKFFNQKKCILMRYLSKLDILIEFFIYGGPLVPLLHTIKQTLSWIKTCFLCKIVLIFHTTVSQEPITWSLQLPCIFVTAFS